jgi:hypothetical protein
MHASCLALELAYSSHEWEEFSHFLERNSRIWETALWKAGVCFPGWRKPQSGRRDKLKQGKTIHFKTLCYA